MLFTVISCSIYVPNNLEHNYNYYYLIIILMSALLT